MSYFLRVIARSVAFAVRPVRETILARHYENIIKASRLSDEPDLLILPDLIRQGWVSVDIGANIGRYTKHLSSLSSKVISIEPVPFTFRVLRRTVASLALKNVQLHNCALSDHDGRGSMKVPNIYEAKLSSGDEIDVRRLDSLLAGESRVDFIKCDVEGHEIAVVNGSVRTIERFKPIWLIESDWDSGLFHRMTELGYECFIEASGKLVPRNGARKTNYFFVHKVR